MFQGRTLNRSLLLVALFLCPLLSFGQSMHHMVAGYLNARANGGNLKWYQRYELGYSLPLYNATFTHQYSDYNPETNVFSDTTIKMSLPTKGYGVHAGLYFPVASVGENTILAIPLHVYGNMNIWKTGNIQPKSGWNYDLDILGMQMALPVGLDMKYGCDGMMDKSQRFCFTGGVGVYPSMNITAFGAEDATMKLKMQPYLKGEVGVFAGICFKLTAMYCLGNINFLDLDSNSPTSTMAGWGDSKIKLQSKSQLTVSLAVMPFSWDWGKRNWWR